MRKKSNNPETSRTKVAVVALFVISILLVVILIEPRESLQVIRAIMAFVIFFFLPGYTWSFILLRKATVDVIERIFLSLLLSLLIIPILLFYASQLGFTISLVTSTIVAITVTGLGALITLLQHKKFINRK